MGIATPIEANVRLSPAQQQHLVQAAQQAMDHAETLASFAQEWQLAGGDREQCIRRAFDASYVFAALHIAAGKWPCENGALFDPLLEGCVVAAKACIAACAEHDDETSRACRETCRQAAGECGEALASADEGLAG